MLEGIFTQMFYLMYFVLNLVIYVYLCQLRTHLGFEAPWLLKISTTFVSDEPFDSDAVSKIHRSSRDQRFLRHKGTFL